VERRILGAVYAALVVGCLVAAGCGSEATTSTPSPSPSSVISRPLDYVSANLLQFSDFTSRESRYWKRVLKGYGSMLRDAAILNPLLPEWQTLADAERQKVRDTVAHTRLLQASWADSAAPSPRFLKAHELWRKWLLRLTKGIGLGLRALELSLQEDSNGATALSNRAGVLLNSADKTQQKLEREWTRLDRVARQEVASARGETAATPTPETLPSYTVAKVEDISLAATKRYVVHIVLPGKSTQGQRMTIARREVERLKRTRPFNAAGVFFYKKKSDIGKAAFGSIDYAPGGDWSAADTVETGDYLSMEYIIQF